MVAQAKRRRWRRGAELGLGKGHLLRRFHGPCPQLSMIGVDHFAREDRKALVLAIAEAHPDRCTILPVDTTQAAKQVEDGSLDFIFIDAGHSYEAVRDDIAAWASKVKPGGWVGGHDYHASHPGVIQAVDEAYGDTVQHLEDAIWWIRQA
jgi:predicted O-methyltransferase YrrM